MFQIQHVISKSQLQNFIHAISYLYQICCSSVKHSSDNVFRANRSPRTGPKNRRMADVGQEPSNVRRSERLSSGKQSGGVEENSSKSTVLWNCWFKGENGSRLCLYERFGDSPNCSGIPQVFRKREH